MHEFDIVRTDKAESDLMEIAMYIAINNSVEVANKVIDKMETAVMRLQNMPFSGSKQNFFYTKKHKYRFLTVDNYLIYYHVDEKNSIVYIDRIRHGAIAPINQLSD